MPCPESYLPFRGYARIWIQNVNISAVMSHFVEHFLAEMNESTGNDRVNPDSIYRSRL